MCWGRPGAACLSRCWTSGGRACAPPRAVPQGHRVSRPPGC